MTRDRATSPLLGSGPIVSVPRVDGYDKVTGAARYPADEDLGPNVGYATLVTSAIAKGRIVTIDGSAALAVPGVRLLLDHRNMDVLPPVVGRYPVGQALSAFQPMQSNEIRFSGQVVALLVADDLETARYAASLVTIVYEESRDPPRATLASEIDQLGPAAVQRVEAAPDHAFGDVEQGLAAADIIIDAEYETPIQHHNPIELFSVGASWNADFTELTIHEPTQWLYGLRAHVAQQVGLQQEAVRIVSHFVGGAFGGKGLAMPHTLAVALAARKLQRPIKLYVSREQMFTIGGYRPGSRSRVRLGARKDGQLVAIAHDYAAQTSRSDPGSFPGADATVAMYDALNVLGRDRFVQTDANAPAPMRAPVEMPSFFAMESAIDELAVALELDPIELRRRNEPTVHPIARVPFSSRSLMECYDHGAAIFGWSRRDPEPGSMRDGDWLVGMGCASALYPTYIGPASVRVRLFVENEEPHATVSLAAHEIGTGIATVVAKVTAEALGIPIANVRPIIGDSSLPYGSNAAGSRGTASVSPATLKAAERVRRRLCEAASHLEARGILKGCDPDRLVAAEMSIEYKNRRIPIVDVLAEIDGRSIEEQVDWAPSGLQANIVRSVQAGSEGAVGPLTDTHAMYAFGAQFVELHLHRYTRVIRAPRLVGVFAAGRIMNRATAHSQLMGGMIWGLASGLHEQTIVDPRSGRIVNGNLAEYLLPVNADIQDVTVEMLDERDDVVNPLGIKGVGELGVVGVAAAVANAVHHATGQRCRHLPIHLDTLIERSLVNAEDQKTK